MQVCSFTISKNFYQKQISDTCGYIAALVIKTFYVYHLNHTEVLEMKLPRAPAKYKLQMPVHYSANLQRTIHGLLVRIFGNYCCLF